MGRFDILCSVPYQDIPLRITSQVCLFSIRGDAGYFDWPTLWTLGQTLHISTSPKASQDGYECSDKKTDHFLEITLHKCLFVLLQRRPSDIRFEGSRPTPENLNYFSVTSN